MSDRVAGSLGAVSVPMDSGAGMSASMGVTAPVGAVSRKDLERAGRTSLRREGRFDLVLSTALPGSASLQRRGVDGTWETISVRSTSRFRRARIDLPQQRASAPRTFRVVFSPKNPNITSWISEDVDG